MENHSCLNTKDDKSKSKIIKMYSDEEFLQIQNSEKVIRKCREGALYDLEKFAKDLYHFFNSTFFKVEKKCLNSIVIDFLQGKNKFFFLQIKGLNYSQINSKPIVPSERIVDSNICKGIFCKANTDPFVLGLKKAIMKIKSQRKFNSENNTMYYMYINYMAEMDEIKKNEHDIYHKFGIYSPLISRPIVKRRQALFNSSSSAEKGTLYECIKMCSLCHDIYLLYENKIKNCKDSYHLIKKQLEYLRMIPIEKWEEIDFDILINLLFTNATPISNTILTFLNNPNLSETAEIFEKKFNSKLSVRLPPMNLNERITDKLIKTNPYKTKLSTYKKEDKKNKLPCLKSLKNLQNKTDYITLNIQNPLGLKKQSIKADNEENEDSLEKGESSILSKFQSIKDIYSKKAK